MRVTDSVQLGQEETPLCVSIQTCGKTACKGMSTRGTTETDETPFFTDRDLDVRARWGNEPEKNVVDELEEDSIGGIFGTLHPAVAPVIGVGLAVALFFSTSDKTVKGIAIGGGAVSAYTLLDLIF